MQTKPFDEDIRRLQGEEKTLRQRRAEHSSRLAWYTGFHPEAARERARALASRIEHRKQDWSRLNAHQMELLDEFRIVDRQGARTFDPRTWFASERAVARRQANALAIKISKAKRRIAVLGNYLDENGKDIRTELAQINDDLEAYGSFDAAQERAAIDQADAALASLMPELHQLQSRKQSLDRAIEPLLRTLNVNLAERAALENAIRKTEHFSAQLDQARTGWEKAQVHNECERQFGEGKPGRVRTEKQRRLDPLKRTIAKLEKEIEGELRRAQLNVRALIVDGNNIANDASNTFIGLTALEALLPELANGRTVIVNFDPGFPRKAKLTRSAIQTRLALAKVYFVPKGGAADQFLIQFADQNPHTYVISNDRFADHAYRDTIGEGRVLTHAILNGFAAIPDLRISVPLPETAPD